MNNDDSGSAVRIRTRAGLLAGTFHTPVKRLPDRGWPAVLLCHGFTGNRIESHYLFVKSSRALAIAGIASLRFDFRGCGESSGRFQDLSIMTQLADALAAWKFLGESPGVDPSRRAVLGLSLGGTVAALLAGELAATQAAPQAVVLWNAVSNPPAVWKQRLHDRQKETGGRLRFPIEHRGHLIGTRFFRDMRDMPHPPTALARSGALTLVIGSVSEAEHAIAYSNSCGSNAKLVVLEGYDHTFARSDWERHVIGITTRWLARRLKAGRPRS